MTVSVAPLLANVHFATMGAKQRSTGNDEGDITHRMIAVAPN